MFFVYLDVITWLNISFVVAIVEYLNMTALISQGFSILRLFSKNHNGIFRQLLMGLDRHTCFSKILFHVCCLCSYVNDAFSIMRMLRSYVMSPHPGLHRDLCLLWLVDASSQIEADPFLLLCHVSFRRLRSLMTFPFALLLFAILLLFAMGDLALLQNYLLGLCTGLVFPQLL